VVLDNFLRGVEDLGVVLKFV